MSDFNCLNFTSGRHEEFRVSKTINDKLIKVQKQVAYKESMQNQSYRKIADQISAYFNRYRSEFVRWGSNFVSVDHDGYEAVCMECGNTVSISTSVELSNYELEISLIGLLRNTCDYHCSNNPGGFVANG